MLIRKCRTCKKELELEASYYRNGTRKGIKYYTWDCRKCHYEKSKPRLEKHRKANSKKIAAYQKEYRMKRKELVTN